MSRNYEMQLEVSEFQPEKAVAIQAAALFEWDDWDGAMGLQGDTVETVNLEATAQGRLYGGETEWDFAKRVRNAIWIANGAACKIRIVATYLDDLPFESFDYGESDYEEWLDGESGSGVQVEESNA